MGRYANFSNGEEYKFWYAVQPSSDVTEFGGQKSIPENVIHWEWNEEDIPLIEAKLDAKKSSFKDDFDYSYEDFIKKVEGEVSYDEETQTTKWAESLRRASFINLGEVILEGLRKDKTLSVEAEC